MNKTLQPGLYLVATPIGNLGDITLRAKETLSRADIVACEDTRQTGKLFELLSLPRPPDGFISLHDHNEEQRIPRIISLIGQKKIVALVSDAGMPLISDPGYKLVRACQEHDLYVTTLPGANAPLSALQLSGLPSDCFTFLGFLPAKSGARQKELEKWTQVKSTLILFETAPRLESCLHDILFCLEDREIAIVREITKLHEDVRRAKISEILENDTKPRGEYVLVIAPAAPEEKPSDEIVRKALQDLQDKENLGLKEASAQIAEHFGLSKKHVYNLGLGKA